MGMRQLGFLGLGAFSMAIGACRAAFGEDLVDMRQLGKRGAILETVIRERSVKRVRGLGDVNGDGLDDLGVIYWTDPGEMAHPYRTCVVFGRRDLWGRHALDELPGRWILGLTNPFVKGRGQARHVHPTGDVNGDGLADFMVGFSSYRFPSDPKRPKAGAGFLVYGGRDLEGEHAIEEVGDTIPGVVFWSSEPTHDSVGFNYANIGDINGDGRDDLAIGAPTSDVDEWERAGVLFVLLETRDLPSRVDLAGVGTEIPGFVLRGTTRLETPDGTVIRPLGALGNGIDALGDFDGDGLGDFLVTADDLFTFYLLRGRRSWAPVIDLGGLDEAGFRELGITAFRTPFDNRTFANPHQQTGIGDIDGDGRSELVVGVTRLSAQFGRDIKDSEVYLFRGSEDFPSIVEMAAVPPGLATIFRPFEFGDSLGGEMAPAGDLNGDQVPDLLVSARGSARDGLKDVGEAYAIFLDPDLPSEVPLAQGFPGIRMLGEGIWEHFGDASSAGDFNGDGALDIAAEASFNSSIPGEVGKGKVYLIYGSGSDRPLLTLLGIAPDFGTLRGGTEAVLRGSGFAGEVSVRFGDREALRVEVVSPSEIRGVTPPAAAPGKVEVTVTVDGESLPLEGGFEYVEPFPEIEVANPGRHGFTAEGDGVLRLGESMTLGDITGDGRAELVLSQSPNVAGGTWKVSVIHGGRRLSGIVDASKPSGEVTVIDLAALGNGGLVGVAGDVNGDEVGDLGLGGNTDNVIVFGRPELEAALEISEELRSGRAVSLVHPGSSGRFRFAPAGDIDGDGVGDAAIGFPDGGRQGRFQGWGEVIFLAGRRSWPREVDLTSDDGILGRLSGSPVEGFGAGLASAGDVNGDGRPDLLSSTRIPERAYLLFGPDGAPGELAANDYILGGGGVTFDVRGSPNFDDTPWVATAGDVDGDGLSDMLFGLWEAGRAHEGVIRLVRGSRTLPAHVELPGFPGTVELIGPDSEGQAGQVGPAGDFNADGLDDFLIASPGPLDPPGRVFVVFGARDYPERIELAHLRGRGLRIEGTVPFGGTRVVVREAGDFDGDGVSDIAFAEVGLNNPGNRVHVVFGLAPETDFIRGDATFDESLNLTDAVFTLQFLFLGGVTPPCEDAADTDDSGTIEITDAIRLLQHLFLGGERPPVPYPERGRDPTGDPLGCRGF